MKSPKEKTDSPKDLLDEFKALIGEAQTMLTDSAVGYSTDAVNNLHERFRVARERFAEFYDGAKKKVTAGADCTDAAIREHPYQALAITLGVGLLAGVLLGRRRK